MQENYPMKIKYSEIFENRSKLSTNKLKNKSKKSFTLMIKFIITLKDQSKQLNQEKLLCVHIFCISNILNKIIENVRCFYWK